MPLRQHDLAVQLGIAHLQHPEPLSAEACCSSGLTGRHCGCPLKQASSAHLPCACTVCWACTGLAAGYGQQLFEVGHFTLEGSILRLQLLLPCTGLRGSPAQVQDRRVSRKKV